LDPLKHILSQDAASSMRATVSALVVSTSKQASPLLAACCGHLLSDLEVDEEDGICAGCNQPFVTMAHRPNKVEEPWTRMWHKLVHCVADHGQQQKFAEYEAAIMSLAEREPYDFEHLCCCMLSQCDAMMLTVLELESTGSAR
jgi:hypothetical protein